MTICSRAIRRTGEIRRIALLCPLLGLLGVACAAPPAPIGPQRVSDGRYAMGTVLELTLFAADPATGQALLERLFAEVSALEDRLSRHRPQSELSRLNRRAGQGAVPTSPELLALVARARDETLRTRGAFDPTVGPLVALWTEAARQDRLPGEAALAAARARVGPSRVRLEAGAIGLAQGSALDLGGIAKGFTLDRLRERLVGQGVVAALLSFGQSSVWAVGAPPDRPGWRLLVRAPDGGVAGFVTLRDQALSVSGSLSQERVIEGRRFGHVVDPRSGWPLEEPGQALVVCRDAAEAEALSTALLVLGAGEGIALLERRPDCEGLLLDAHGGRFESREFSALARFEAAIP